MNHVSESALVVGILLLIFIVPVYVIARLSRKKRQAKLIEQLQTAVSLRQLDLTHSELLDNKIIGWSKEDKMLLFAVHHDDGVIVNDLSAASRAYVIRNMNGSAVKSVMLQIADSNNMILCGVPFYEQFTDNELKLKRLETQARDWEQLLNVHFKR